MELKISLDLIESLIKLYDDFNKDIWPNGSSGDIDIFSEEHREENRKVLANLNRQKWFQIVESLEEDKRSELIAIMLMGYLREFKADDFPMLLNQAPIGEGAAPYLFKNGFSNYMRQGLAKLNLK